MNLYTHIYNHGISEDVYILLDQIIVAHMQCQGPNYRSAMLVATAALGRPGMIEWLVMAARMR
jgi:hypothetical protein